MTNKQRIAIRTTQERYRFDPEAWRQLHQADEIFSFILDIMFGPPDARIVADLARLRGIMKTLPPDTP